MRLCGLRLEAVRVRIAALSLQISKAQPLFLRLALSGAIFLATFDPVVNFDDAAYGGLVQSSFAKIYYGV